MSDEYIPQIYMIGLAGGKKVDCYFTNGAVRRYDVSAAIRAGGVFAPLADRAVFEKSVTVMDGVLAFDFAGTRDPYAVADICADVVYADGAPLPREGRALSRPHALGGTRYGLRLLRLSPQSGLRPRPQLPARKESWHE